MKLNVSDFSNSPELSSGRGSFYCQVSYGPSVSTSTAQIHGAHIKWEVLFTKCLFVLPSCCFLQAFIRTHNKNGAERRVHMTLVQYTEFNLTYRFGEQGGEDPAKVSKNTQAEGGSIKRVRSNTHLEDAGSLTEELTRTRETHWTHNWQLHQVTLTEARYSQREGNQTKTGSEVLLNKRQWWLQNKTGSYKLNVQTSDIKVQTRPKSISTTMSPTKDNQKSTTQKRPYNTNTNPNWTSVCGPGEKPILN